MNRILLIIAISLSLKGVSQDTHFSQFHLMPTQLNPAMTGFFDGDLRVGAVYRNQWFNVGTNAVYGGNTKFETYGGFADGNIKLGKHKEDYLGIGFVGIRDRAGDQGYTTSDVRLSIAYSKGFGHKVKHSIALGLQGEMLFTQFRNGGAIFPDAGKVENIGNLNIGADATVGLRYHINFEKRLNMYFGVAYAHIVRSKLSFLNVPSAEKLYSKYVGHAGAVIGIRDRVNLVPNIMVLSQGSALDINLGANAQFIFGNTYDYRNTFSFGLNARFGRPEGASALIPNVRVDVYNFILGVAYDIDVTKLSKSDKTVGALEVAANYIFKFKKHQIPTNVNCAVW